MVSGNGRTVPGTGTTVSGNESTVSGNDTNPGPLFLETRWFLETRI
jgi:hypothetical protein